MIEEDKIEAVSMMLWLERRVDWGVLSLPMHVRTFKAMWFDHFGTIENIPQDFKDKVTTRYEEMKKNNKREGE